MIKFFLTTFILYYSLFNVSAVEQTIQGLHVPKGDSIELPSSFFSSNSLKGRNSGNINRSNSRVWLTYFSKGLKFTFECNKNKRNYDDNTNRKYIKSYQEIFQISLSQAENNIDSFEFKLNPNGEISVFKNNKVGYQKIDAKNSGIRYGIHKENNKSWKGWIFIPFSLIGKSKKYKLSFVRIIKLS